MPYKDAKLRSGYEKKQYEFLKKKLLRMCPKCQVRTCAFGKTCRPCSKGDGITWAKRTALKRDNYTCQKCGLKEEGLVEVDHVIPCRVAPELYCEISNLMTLCPNCHKRKTLNERRKNYNCSIPVSTEAIPTSPPSSIAEI